METDASTRHILLLCLSLISAAVSSGIVMLALMKSTLDTLQLDTAALNQLKWEINLGASGIRQHLENARDTIHDIINHHESDHSGPHDSAELGKLNLSIREFAMISPADNPERLKAELDALASSFVTLHYEAANWRTEHDSFIETRNYEKHFGAVQDLLKGLLDTVDTRTAGLFPDAQQETPPRPEPAEPRRHDMTGIYLQLLAIGNIIDGIYAANSAATLARVDMNRVEAAFTALIRQITDAPPVLDISKVRQLHRMVMGYQPAGQSGQGIADASPDLHTIQRERLLLMERQDELNERLAELADRISASLRDIEYTAQSAFNRLDTATVNTTQESWWRLTVIGISSAVVFLILVFLILRAVRKQVHLLALLKTRAENESLEKQLYMQRLGNSETRYRTVVENMRGAVVTMDTKGNIDTMNPAARDMFGYSVDQVSGINITTLMLEKERPLLRGMLEGSTGNPATSAAAQLDLTGLRRDGSRFPLSLALSKMQINNRQMYTVIMLDMTERTEYEMRLLEEKNRAEASNQAKSEFLTMMSHEIRTPMNSILGMSQLLLDTQPDRRQQRFMTNILDSGKHLLNIINDILDLSRIEAHRMDIQVAPFDVVEMLKYIARQFAASAAAKGIEIQCHFKVGKHHTWMGDSKHIAQVLTNLVGNAVKFTHSGTIRIGVSADAAADDAARLHFSVEDTGMGISEESRLKIFEAFTQADGTTTRKYGGSGLGLAISQRLVRLMGGEIGVESTPGEGSQFWFELTLARATTTAPVAAVREQPEMQLPVLDADVLLVEDNLINQEVALHMLESLSCRVWLAADGIEALTMTHEHEFDLVLMDCQMPRMDGYEATRNIRKREAAQETARHLPIVALTANAMSSDQQRCLDAGMDDYISKPLTVATLAGTLSRILQHAPDEANNGIYIPTANLPATGAEPQALNPDIISVYRDMEHGEALLARMIEVYLEEAPLALDRLSEAINADDPEALGRTAHKFKSSNMQLGADKMADLCGQLDKLGKLGTTTGAGALLAELEQAFTEARALLLDGLPGRLNPTPVNRSAAAING